MTDWINKIPPFDTQFSEPTLTDIDNCVEISLCNIVYMLTGFRASARTLSALLHRDGLLTKAGSRDADAISYANKYGLVPYDFYPTPPSFTYDEYLAVPDQSILSQALKCQISLLKPDLNVSPLWTETSAGSMAHMVAQINPTQYVDSEPGGEIKTFLNPIVYQTSLSVKLTLKSMITFVHKTGTSEYGFLEVTNFTEIYHRGISEPDIKFQAIKFGLNVLNPDGTINFNLAKDITI